MEIVLGRNGFSITDISEEERVEVAEYFGKPKLLGIAHECLPVVRALLEIFATAEPPIKIDLRELEAEHPDITPFHLRQGVAYIALGLEEVPGAKFPDKNCFIGIESFLSFVINILRILQLRVSRVTFVNINQMQRKSRDVIKKHFRIVSFSNTNFSTFLKPQFGEQLCDNGSVYFCQTDNRS